MSKKLTSGNDALQTNQNPLESIVENKVTTTNHNEIILLDTINEESSSIQLYSNIEDNLKIEVLCYNETVWLNREQLAELFGRDIKTIGKHINNALREELKDLLVVAKFATTKDYGRRSGFTQTREIDYYNLEMITSIGYRVKSRQGILFRQWANKVLKEYLLRGYAVNQRINQLEDKIDRRFADYDSKIKNLNEQVDFFVKTSLPPAEKVFFDGQLFDAEEKQSMLEALQHIYDTQCIKMPIFNGDYKPVSDNTLACVSYADIKSKRYNVRLISLDDYIFNRNSEMADNAEIIASYNSLEQLVDDGWVLY